MKKRLIKILRLNARGIDFAASKIFDTLDKVERISDVMFRGAYELGVLADWIEGR